MLFYRVERINGEGCYNGSWPCYYTIKEEERTLHFYSEQTHPIWQNDYLLYEQLRRVSDFNIRNYLFGFGSMRQFYKWFHRYYILHKLDSYGFFLSVYECEDVYVGDSQAIALKTKMVFLDRQPLI